MQLLCKSTFDFCYGRRAREASDARRFCGDGWEYCEPPGKCKAGRNTGASLAAKVTGSILLSDLACAERRSADTRPSAAPAPHVPGPTRRPARWEPWAAPDQTNCRRLQRAPPSGPSSGEPAERNVGQSMHCEFFVGEPGANMRQTKRVTFAPVVSRDSGARLRVGQAAPGNRHPGACTVPLLTHLELACALCAVSVLCGACCAAAEPAPQRHTQATSTWPSTMLARRSSDLCSPPCAHHSVRCNWRSSDYTTPRCSTSSSLVRYRISVVAVLHGSPRPTCWMVTSALAGASG